MRSRSCEGPVPAMAGDVKVSSVSLTQVTAVANSKEGAPEIDTEIVAALFGPKPVPITLRVLPPAEVKSPATEDTVGRANANLAGAPCASLKLLSPSVSMTLIMCPPLCPVDTLPEPHKSATATVHSIVVADGVLFEQATFSLPIVMLLGLPKLLPARVKVSVPVVGHSVMKRLAILGLPSQRTVLR